MEVKREGVAAAATGDTPGGGDPRRRLTWWKTGLLSQAPFSRSGRVSDVPSTMASQEARSRLNDTSKNRPELGEGNGSAMVLRTRALA